LLRASAVAKQRTAQSSMYGKFTVEHRWLMVYSMYRKTARRSVKLSPNVAFRRRAIYSARHPAGIPARPVLLPMSCPYFADPYQYAKHRGVPDTPIACPSFWSSSTRTSRLIIRGVISCHVPILPCPEGIGVFLCFANVYLGKGRSPARLDGLNLGGGEGRAVEAGREVVAVKVVALGRRHGAEVGPGQAADTAAARLDGLAERPELLGVVAVRAERRVRRGEALGERAGRRGRVRVRGMVDRSCPGSVSAALVRISREPPSPRTGATYKEGNASR
jgi:hypothetical protein